MRSWTVKVAIKPTSWGWHTGSLLVNGKTRIPSTGETRSHSVTVGMNANVQGDLRASTALFRLMILNTDQQFTKVRLSEPTARRSGSGGVRCPTRDPRTWRYRSFPIPGATAAHTILILTGMTGSTNSSVLGQVDVTTDIPGEENVHTADRRQHTQLKPDLRSIQDLLQIAPRRRGRTEPPCAVIPTSGKDLADLAAVDVGEHNADRMFVGEILVVPIEHVRDGGVPVVDVNASVDGFSLVVGRSVSDAGTSPAPSHPHGEPLRIVVPSIAVLERQGCVRTTVRDGVVEHASFARSVRRTGDGSVDRGAAVDHGLAEVAMVIPSTPCRPR